MKIAQMAWIWPQMLWLLCLLPLAVVAYIWRRRRNTGSGSGAAWLVASSRRDRLPHGPAVCVLLGMALMVIATARPQAVVMVPQRVDAVMLVLDTSGSMRADDVAPSRIEAAKEAIRRFIERQPASMKVGLVTVAATAVVAQMPTTDREALGVALDGVALQRGSALGAGIAVALTAILPPGTVPLQAILNGEFKDVSAPAQAPGTRDSVAVVLISDGAGNMEPDVRKMARLAAGHGVRVYTVGIGTTQGALLRSQGMSMRVRLEEEGLKWVAAETAAEYFAASDVAGLHRVYDAMGRNIVFRQHRQTEVTGLVLLVAVLCLAAGAAVGVFRSGRVV